MSHHDHPKSLSRSAARFLSGTLCSRFTGLFRDMAMAFFFGSNPVLAAFMVAFRFAALFRRLFGENSIASGFIPSFEAIRMESGKKGAEYFRDLFYSLFFFLSGILAVVELVLYAIYGYFRVGHDTSVLIYMMLIVPGVVFICLFGLHSALLQCEKRYFLPGFAPAAFNFVWIAAVWWLHGQTMDNAMELLSISVALAFFSQWAMLLPHTLRYLRSFLAWKEFVRAKLFSKEIRALWKPMSLGMIGVAAVQLNTALDGVFARFASLEGPAYLWYAIRLQQVPLALFGVAIASALLPPLSRAVKEGSKERFGILLDFAFRRTWSLIVPCSFAILVLGVGAVNLLYGRGDFSVEATKQTVDCLWGYGIGLLPTVLTIILIPPFQAEKNYHIPTIAALLSVGVNIFLNAFFVFILGWGAYSISVATSIAAIVSSSFLLHQCAKKLSFPSLLSKGMMVCLLKILVCAILASVAALWIGEGFLGDATISLLLKKEEVDFSRDFMIQAMQFSVMGIAFVAVFFASAFVLQAGEALELLPFRKRQQGLPFSKGN